MHVMTHHGTPLKQMGMDQLDHPASIKDKDFAAQMRRADRWDFSVSANAHTTEAWERAYPCQYETLEVGYPRNDRLATATAAEVAAVRERFGIEPDEKVVLYTPTHREWLPPGKQVLDVEDLADRLGPDTVLMVRAHYFYVSGRRKGALARDGQLIDASALPGRGGPLPGRGRAGHRLLLGDVRLRGPGPADSSSSPRTGRRTRSCVASTST